MDDYIAEILAKEALWMAAGDPEEVRRRLGEAAALPRGREKDMAETAGTEGSGSGGPSRRETEEEGPERREAHLRETLRGLGEQETAFSALERAQKNGVGGAARETSSRGSFGAAGETGTIQSGRAAGETESGAAGAWPETGAGTGSGAMTPEAFSLFFERDARRYS